MAQEGYEKPYSEIELDVYLKLILVISIRHCIHHCLFRVRHKSKSIILFIYPHDMPSKDIEEASQKHQVSCVCSEPDKRTICQLAKDVLVYDEEWISEVTTG